MTESRNGKKEKQIILRLMLHLLGCQKERKIFASSGNRTRAARVAGEHSTTEPTMPTYLSLKGQLRSYFHTESMHAELPGSR